MKVSIENIGRFQDQFLLGIKKGEEIWSCERNLKFVLEHIFPNQQIFQNKKFVLNSKTYFPDYRIEPLKIIVEFQGYQHFTSSKNVYFDWFRKGHFEHNGYTFIELPYFIQLTPHVLTFLFSEIIQKLIHKDFSNGFPHGFIHPKAVVLGDFCVDGLNKANCILSTFDRVICDSIREDCYRSLEIRANIDNVLIESYNPLLENVSTIHKIINYNQ